MGPLRTRYIVVASLTYLVLGLLWIFLSDGLLLFFSDIQSVYWLSTGKGVFFVFASALIFYLALRAMPQSESKLQEVIFSDSVIERRRAWLTYSFAITITLIMVFIRLNLGITSEHRPLMILFMLPIILSALFGGFGPGFVATALSALSVNYLILSPTNSFKIFDQYELLQWCFLIFNGLVVSVFFEILIRLKANAEKNLKLLNVVVSGTTDAIFVKNLSGKYLFLNKAAAKFLGKPIAEVLGKNDKDLFSEDSAEIVMNNDQEIMQNARILSREEHLVSFEGDCLVFDVTKGPMFDEAGKVIGLFGISRDITELKKKNESLLISESRLKEAHLLAKLGDWSWDIETNKHTWSNETYQIYGINPNLAPPDYYDVEKYFTPKSWKQLSETVNTALINGLPYEQDAELVRADGSHRWVTARGEGVFDGNGKVIRLHGTIQDITERKLAEIDLQIAAVAFESQDSIMITDATLKILRVNKAFTKIFGYSFEEAVGKSANLLRSNIQNDDFYNEMWRIVNTTGSWQGEITNRHKDGRLLTNLLSISEVKGSDGVITHYVGSHVDITERKADADKILHIAYHDSLTGLPNRQYFNERAQFAITSSARNSLFVALLLIDLDNFKSINDTLGHDIGDLLLQEVAKRLRLSVRDGDMVARVGGDEFVVLLEELTDELQNAVSFAELVGNKIINNFNQPYQLGNHEYHSTCSIGITLFEGNRLTVADLLKQADIAMYQAKSAGRNTLRFFNPQMQDNFNVRAALEIDLHKAIENKEFRLYYQIQVDQFGKPIGAEALIRWISPTRGMVPPNEFIPFAEGSGLILPIGQWVLDTACAQLAAWRKNKLTKALTIAINVSAKQFSQPDFVEQVQSRLLHYKVEAKYLKLEITEGALLENLDNIITSMIELEAIGVQLSLDDFGTGYSSLLYLKKLPFDQIKIDKSFVRDLLTDNNDRTIVRTIIAMANSMGFEVIAEGVETNEQKMLLINKGCTYFQGYLFGRPMPIEEFENLLS